MLPYTGPFSEGGLIGIALLSAMAYVVLGVIADQKPKVALMQSVALGIGVMCFATMFRF